MDNFIEQQRQRGPLATPKGTLRLEWRLASNQVVGEGEPPKAELAILEGRKPQRRTVEVQLEVKPDSA
jgi:hypothetical protein